MSEKKGKPHSLKSRKLAEALAHDAKQELAPDPGKPHPDREPRIPVSDDRANSRDE